jgi:hypothetical protein
MKNLKSVNLFGFPFYPFLLACYPALSLLQVNFQEVDPRVVIRPLLASVLFTAAIFMITFAITRRIHQSAAFTALCLILFFSYGHIYNMFSAQVMEGFFLGRHRWLIISYLILFLVITWLIFTKMKDGLQITKVINPISLVLVALPVIQILSIGVKQSNSAVVLPRQERMEVESSATGEKPDIYYIILDMYTREDSLKQDFNFDNSPFIHELQSRGFYVADCSRANYVKTQLSIASSLNMDYIPNLAPELDPQIDNMDGLMGYIKDNRVRLFLENEGYKTVAFDTGYFWDSWFNADYYFSTVSSSRVTSLLTPFEGLFLNTTALLPLIESQILVSQNDAAEIQNPVQLHIERELYKLDKIGQIAGISNPKFVYAHFMVPHEPFVFREDGSIQSDIGFYSEHNNPIDEKHYLDGYTQQVEFINDRILAAIDHILKTSQNPPVIILQGDHGARNENRHTILNAYYLPGVDTNLYPNISPVNTFRLIFDSFFNAGLGFLPDKSYFSTLTSPYQYEEKPELSPLCLP